MTLECNLLLNDAYYQYLTAKAGVTMPFIGPKIVVCPANLVIDPRLDSM